MSKQRKSGQNPFRLGLQHVARRYEKTKKQSVMSQQSAPAPASAEMDWQDWKERFRGPRKRVDPGLLIAILLLFVVGSLMLFSSSMTTGLYSAHSSAGYYIIRQIAFLFFGFMALLVFTRIPPRRFNARFWVYGAVGLSFIMLILVLIPGIGRVIQGARRWLPLPGDNTFQPSEFTKISVVLFLGWYYSRLLQRRKTGVLPRARNPRNQPWKDAWYDVILPMSVVAMQLVLISLQAHMSAVVIIFSVCCFIMASAGVRLGSWIRGGVVGVGVLVLLLLISLSLSLLFPNANFSQRWKHVGTRLNIFTQSEEVQDDVKMQGEQALVAIGSGGFTGVGIGQSRQKYRYLAENHNDYIFSIYCEETGFVGGVGLVLLFGAYLYFGMRTAHRTRTLFGRVLASGITYLLTLQAYLSIGVNLALLPPTGISLPFFSYGGTSNIFFLVGAGLLLSVSKYDRLQPEVADQTRAGAQLAGDGGNHV